MSAPLATLWLDADRATYEALCTGGAATVTVLGGAPHPPETRTHHARLPRRLPPCDGAALHGDEGGAAGRACRGGGDADARLDVLEEVQLCNIVPVLPRTFATADLVQQLVPCTHFFASSSSAATVPSSDADNTGYPRSCLAHVRRAADAHVRRLRTTVRATHAGLFSATAPSSDVDGDGGAVPPPPPLPTYMSGALTLDALARESRSHSSTADEVDREGEEGTSAVAGVTTREVTEPACGASPRAESSAAPPYGPSALSLLADSPVRAAGTEHGGGSVDPRDDRSEEKATRHVLRLRPAAPLTPARPAAVDTEDAQSIGGEAVPEASAAAAAALHRDAYDGTSPAPTPTACTTFAAAQAQYLLFRDAHLLQRRHRYPPAPRRAAAAPVTKHHDGSGAAAVAVAGSADLPHPATATAAAPLDAAEAFWATAPASRLAPHPAALTTAHAAAVGGAVDVTECRAADRDEERASQEEEEEDDDDDSSSCDDVDTGAAADALALSHSSLLAAMPHAHHNAAPVEVFAGSALPPQQGGAIVEWAAGPVSYTADTLGLFEEQQLRAERFYQLPPPHPDVVGGGRPDDGAGPSAEDRTSLRGAVLAQLHRLRRARGARCGCVTAVAAAAGTAAASGAGCAAARGPAVDGAAVSREASPASVAASGRAEDAADVPCAATAAGSLRRGRCPCFRCSPLLFQFAQVPAMPSAVLRWYLDILHRTALPGLVPTTASASPGPLAADAAVAPARPRRGRPPKRPRDDAVPASGSPTSTAHGAGHHGSPARPRGAPDPLGVFPGLPQWRAQQQQQHPHRRPASRLAEHEEGEQGPSRERHATRAPTREAGEVPRHVAASSRAPMHDGADRAPPVPATAAAGATSVEAATPSLDWVDDAVLDEAVIVGVVPRGRPHELRLVCPSRAFCMALVQGLEEAAEAAGWVLAFIPPPPSSSAVVSCAGELAEDPDTHSERGGQHAGANGSGASGARDAVWHAWLRRQYFAALWAALQTRLTPQEWQLVVQAAHDSPWLGESAPQTYPCGRSPSTSTGTDAACAPSRSAIRASVQAAAADHVEAVVSASEDLICRVTLTALVPVLHRRLRVLYELLRHLASKALYASHRLQCEAYWNWYTGTPSPGAVLRLLQRSTRFARALARCYPQYHLLHHPDASTAAAAAAHANVGEGEARRQPASGVTPAFASQPTAVGTATRRFPVSPCHTTTATSSTTAAVSGSADTSLLTPAAAAAAASVSPSTDRTRMTYVPEAALLDPCHLQRFALWRHRASHGGGPGGGGGGAAAAADFDYLREVPVAEQDGALRAVLRSFAQKGRTLDWEEVRRHVDSRHQTAYVYH